MNLPSFTRRAMAGCALFILTSACASANIVLNGDFELTDIGNTLFVPVYVGDSTITNWVVEAPVPGNGVDIVSISTGTLQLANTGFQSIDMAGTPGRASIYQDLSTTVGAFYTLSFFASSNGGPYVNGLTVQWGGSNVATVNTPGFGTFSQFTYQVQATSATTRLEFVGNVDGLQGPLLDTVSVDASAAGAAPEPATLGLAGGAMLLAALY